MDLLLVGGALLLLLLLAAGGAFVLKKRARTAAKEEDKKDTYASKSGAVVGEKPTGLRKRRAPGAARAGRTSSPENARPTMEGQGDGSAQEKMPSSQPRDARDENTSSKGELPSGADRAASSEPQMVKDSAVPAESPQEEGAADKAATVDSLRGEVAAPAVEGKVAEQPKKQEVEKKGEAEEREEPEEIKPEAPKAPEELSEEAQDSSETKRAEAAVAAAATAAAARETSTDSDGAGAAVAAIAAEATQPPTDREIEPRVQKEEETQVSEPAESTSVPLETPIQDAEGLAIAPPAQKKEPFEEASPLEEHEESSKEEASSKEDSSKEEPSKEEPSSRPVATETSEGSEESVDGARDAPQAAQEPAVTEPDDAAAKGDVREVVESLEDAHKETVKENVSGDGQQVAEEVVAEVTEKQLADIPAKAPVEDEDGNAAETKEAVAPEIVVSVDGTEAKELPKPEVLDSEDGKLSPSSTPAREESSSSSDDGSEERSGKKHRKHHKKHHKKHKKHKKHKEKSKEEEEEQDGDASSRRPRSHSKSHHHKKHKGSEESSEEVKSKRSSRHSKEKSEDEKKKKKRTSRSSKDSSEKESKKKHKHKHKHREEGEAASPSTPSSPATPATPVTPASPVTELAAASGGGRDESPGKKKRISLLGKNMIKKKLHKLSSLTGKQAQSDIRAAMQEGPASPSTPEGPSPSRKTRKKADKSPRPAATEQPQPPQAADVAEESPVTTPVVLRKATAAENESAAAELTRRLSCTPEAEEPTDEEAPQLPRELEAAAGLAHEQRAHAPALEEAGAVSESLAELMDAASGVRMSLTNLPPMSDEILGLEKAANSPTLTDSGIASSLAELIGGKGLPPVPKSPRRSASAAKEESKAAPVPVDQVADEAQGKDGSPGHEDRTLENEPLYNVWNSVQTSNPTAEWVTLLDNGTTALKGGLAGHRSPSVLVPPLAARPRAGSRTSMLGPNEAVIYGKEAMEAVVTPFKDGVITEWGDMQTLWERAFRSISVDVNEEGHSLFLTAPEGTDLAKLGEVVFEHFGVPSLNVVCQEQAALASGREWNGVSVNLGGRTSAVVPILFGEVVRYALRRFAVTGSVLTQHISTMLPWEAQAQQLGAMSERNRRRLASHVKETNLSVALPDGSTAGEEGRLVNEVDVEGSIDLRFASVLVPKDLTSGPEIIFSPEAACGSGVLGLHKLIVEAVLACPSDARVALLSNIVLSGGSSQFPGLCTRLAHEVRKALPSELQGAAVNVKLAEHPQLAAYSGLRNLAHAPFYGKQCATLEEYHEHGANCVVRRFS